MKKQLLLLPLVCSIMSATQEEELTSKDFFWHLNRDGDTTAFEKKINEAYKIAMEKSTRMNEKEKALYVNLVNASRLFNQAHLAVYQEHSKCDQARKKWILGDDLSRALSKSLEETQEGYRRQKVVENQEDTRKIKAELEAVNKHRSDDTEVIRAELAWNSAVRLRNAAAFNQDSARVDYDAYKTFQQSGNSSQIKNR